MPDALTHPDALSNEVATCAQGRTSMASASGVSGASVHDEAEERLAIQSETTLAARQSIGQARMVAGLMATAGSPWK
jgi:hypothetical protein